MRRPAYVGAELAGDESPALLLLVGEEERDHGEDAEDLRGHASDSRYIHIHKKALNDAVGCVYNILYAGDLVLSMAYIEND